jgi:PST family polysaccharide transporter
MENQNRKEYNLKERFYQGIKWKSITQFITISSRFIATLILARLILPKDFGLYGIVQIFIAFSVTLLNTTISPALIQKKNLTLRHISSGNFLAITMGVLLILIFWSFAPFISKFFKNEQLIPLLRVLSFKFLFDSMSIIPIAIIRKEIDYKSLFWIMFSSLVIGQSLISILFAFLNFGVYSLVLGALLSSFFMFLTSLIFFTRKGYSFKIGYYKNEVKDIISFGKWTTMTNFASTGANRGDYFIIGKWLDNFSLGIYTKAYYLMQMGSIFIVEIFSNVFFPTFSKVQDDREKIKNVILGFIPFISIVIITIMLFIIFNAKTLVILILGKKWITAVVPLKILCFFGVFRGVYKILDSVVLSLGKVKVQFFIYFFYMGLIVLFSLLGLKWGLKGVSYGVGMSIFIVFLLLLFYVSFILKIKIKDWIFVAKPVLFYGIFFYLSFFILSKYIIFEKIYINILFNFIIWFFLWVFILFILKLRFFNPQFYYLIKKQSSVLPVYLAKIVCLITDKEDV